MSVAAWASHLPEVHPFLVDLAQTIDRTIARFQGRIGILQADLAQLRATLGEGSDLSGRPKPGPRLEAEARMNPDQKRWLQLAYVAVCAARADVACTEEALREVLLGSMPAVKSDKATGAATAEIEPRADSVPAAAAALERSRGFFYEWLKRRRRPWGSTDWVYYGAELRRRRLLARCSVAELERRTRLPASIIRRIEQGFGRPRPSKRTLAQLALALGMPMPPRPAGAGKTSPSGKPPK